MGGFAGYAGLSLVTSGLLFLYFVVGARLLDVSEYGLLASLFGTTVLLGVVFTAVQTQIAGRLAAARESRGRAEALAGARRFGLRCAAAYAVAAAVVALPLSMLLRAPLVDVGLVALATLAMLAWAALLGVLQGFGALVALGTMNAGQAALRLVGLIVGARFGGLTGALLLTAVALVLSTAALSVVVRAAVRSRAADAAVAAPADDPKAARSAGFGATLLVTLGAGLPTVGDVIAVRAHLDAISAGSWASAALIGRITVFLAAIVAAAAYPRFVVAVQNGRGRRLAFGVAGGVLVLTAPLALVSALAPAATLHLFAPAAGAQATAVLPAYALAMWLLSGSSALAYSALAAHRTYFIRIAVPAFLTAFLLICGLGSSISVIVDLLLLLAALWLLVGTTVVAMTPGRVDVAAIAARPLRRRRVGQWLRRLGWALLGILASMMVVLIGLPASTWTAPTNDFTMNGFDPVLMYSQSNSSSGAVDVSSGQTTLTASQGAHSLVHLVSSPLSFDSAFDLTVSRADPGSSPAMVELTSPYLNNEIRLAFMPSPAKAVELQRVVDGRTVDSRKVGTYEIGETYHVRAVLDRAKRSARLILGPTGESNVALFLTDHDGSFEGHAFVRKAVPVEAGQQYVLSTKLTTASPGLAGISLNWFDKKGRRIAQSSAWNPLVSGPGTTRRVITATAPAGARTVQPETAVGAGGSASFGAISLQRAGATTNLLPHGGVGKRARVWKRASGDTPLQTRSYVGTTADVSADAATFPKLFGALRMALTVETSADNGAAQLVLQHYRLAVPHQRWLATRVSDPALQLAERLLTAAGVVGLVVVMLRRREFVLAPLRRLAAFRLTLTPTHLVVAGVIGAYLLISLLLDHLGSLNADLVGARVWTYVSARYGPAELYFVPNVSSAEAVQWQGSALQEAGFPYGPTMAYLFAIFGGIYQLGLGQPALGTPDASVADLLVRGANTLFGVVAAWLIVQIVRGFGLRNDRAVALGGVFLLAPALAIANSVWGTTQTLSMVFLLGAILAVQRNRLTVGWVLLLAAMMTRPQNLISAVVLAVWLIATTPVRSTLRAVITAIVVVFVALSPILIAVAPSLPFDVVSNALFLHVGSGNDVWTDPLSWGAPSPWPLAAMVFSHAGATDSILFPASTRLLGPLTYDQVGTIVFGLYLVALLAVTVLRRNTLRIDGRYVLPATLAVLALLQLKTGAPTYHMLQPTALCFLLVRALPFWSYLYSTIALSLTTAWSMSALGVYWLQQHPLWATGLFDPHTVFAHVLAASVGSSVVVAIACILNTGVLVVLSRQLLVGWRGTERAPAISTPRWRSVTGRRAAATTE